jgi:hypothetical protein
VDEASCPSVGSACLAGAPVSDRADLGAVFLE